MDPNYLLPPSSASSLPIPQLEGDEAQNQPITTTTASLPFASISLSLSHLSLFSSPRASSLSPFPFHLKIPSQISALTLSLFSSSPSSSKRSGSSKISNSLILSPSPLLRRRPADPSSAAAARRCAIVWFRADLRLHDHEPLSAANADCLSLLPVFVFDPRDFGGARSAGFDRTGPRRARFLLDSVADLRASLCQRGSDLVVRVGHPETVLPELARAVGADAVYAHREASHNEVRAEERVSKAMEEEGVEMKYFWGSTLHHIEDLPFDLKHMPTNYGGFRDKVKGVMVRKTIETPDEIKGLPMRGDVKAGELPCLQDLGFNPVPMQDGMSAFPVGGEIEALERLKKFAAECHAQPYKGNNRDNIYGANFSCKISPWLTTGCLSPRFMFEELKKTATRTISTASSQRKSADGGMNWLVLELLWRDFFRFVTMKCSSAETKVELVPAAEVGNGTGSGRNHHPSHTKEEEQL